MGRKRHKLIIFFIGTLSGILLLEICLRIMGFCYSHRGGYDKEFSGEKEDNCITILCLGDSVTMGIGGGPRSNSYPSQLQNLLDLEYGKGRIEVINTGRAWGNTSRLLDCFFNGFIKEVKPDIILFLGGIANFTNYWGYHRYIESKRLKGKGYVNQKRKRRKILTLLQEQLYKIKTYNMARLLYFNIKDRGRKEKNMQYIQGAFLENKHKGKNKVDRGVSYEKIEEMTKNSNLYTRIGEVYFRDMENYDEAAKWFKKGAFVNPEDRKNYDYLAGVYTAWCGRGKSIDDIISFIKEMITINPDIASSYIELASFSLIKGDKKQALEMLKKGISLEKGDRELDGGCWKIGCFFLNQGKYQEGVEFLEGIKPQGIEDVIEILKNKGDISDWITYDVEKIIAICKKEKIKIILQNYPSNEYKRASVILEKIAEKYALPFVNNQEIFQDLLRKGEPAESLFSSDYDHPNAKGYAVMAKNVFDKLEKEEMLNFK